MPSASASSTVRTRWTVPETGTAAASARPRDIDRIPAIQARTIRVLAVGQVFGGRVVRARKVMHGKTSAIYHNGKGVFRDLSLPFEATRYHSLVVERDTLPDCLEITAWTQTEAGEIDEIMGLRHRQMSVEGVQFHPESILTAHGHDLLRNFLEQ